MHGYQISNIKQSVLLCYTNSNFKDLSGASNSADKLYSGECFLFKTVTSIPLSCELQIYKLRHFHVKYGSFALLVQGSTRAYMVWVNPPWCTTQSSSRQRSVDQRLKGLFEFK